jgi:hypothetical protein
VGGLFAWEKPGLFLLAKIHDLLAIFVILLSVFLNLLAKIAILLAKNHDLLAVRLISTN